MNREFKLPDADEEFLFDYGLPWETIRDGSMWLLIHDFHTHAEYIPSAVTVAIRVETGYPNSPLDMVYVYPPLVRADGKTIPATQVAQIINSKTFQRWSRHRSRENPWIQGQDDLGSHIILVEEWFNREFEE